MLQKSQAPGLSAIKHPRPCAWPLPSMGHRSTGSADSYPHQFIYGTRHKTFNFSRHKLIGYTGLARVLLIALVLKFPFNLGLFIFHTISDLGFYL